ncbi:MAG: hypothetical protein AUK48_01875 [Oscillatoriales cyanobacterium CG2_30_44_21]|nr:MAG: hypothetical protein AUK48_01875 [Oscillatoriales cyanobacterium CG2_30_44_21]
MKKYNLAASLVCLTLTTISACTPSAPETSTPSVTASSQLTEAPKSTANPDVKSTDKSVMGEAAIWQDYNSEAGKFSVQVPSKPQEQSQEQATDVGTIKLNMLISEANDSGYFIGYADFPSKLANPEDIQKGLADSVKGSVANIKGEVESEKEYLLGEVPCRDFEAIGKVQSTDVLMKGRFCLADKRLYQLFALGSQANLSKTDVDRFINSFKINS